MTPEQEKQLDELLSSNNPKIPKVVLIVGDELYEHAVAAYGKIADVKKHSSIIIGMDFSKAEETIISLLVHGGLERETVTSDVFASPYDLAIDSLSDKMLDIMAKDFDAVIKAADYSVVDAPKPTHPIKPKQRAKKQAIPARPVNTYARDKYKR